MSGHLRLGRGIKTTTSWNVYTELCSESPSGLITTRRQSLEANGDIAHEERLMGQLIRVEDGHPAYDTIKQFVNSRIDFAKKRLDGRRDKWREAEKQYRAYLDLEAIDRQRKRKDGDATYPGFAPLIIPIPYAIVNTILTYLVTVFAARRPIIQIDGVGPEDIKPGEALETVMAYQMDYTRLLLRLYQWFHDVLVYGVGYM